MKNHDIFIPLLIAVVVIVAGCATDQPSPPATTVTVPDTTPTAAPTNTAPADLARAWKLSLMAIQNGTVIQRPVAEVTLTVLPDGTMYGYSGCNNYNSMITVTGEMTQSGSAITVRPITATLKYCEQITDQETTYFAILENAMAYTVNVDKLTITATDGTALVYEARSS